MSAFTFDILLPHFSAGSPLTMRRLQQALCDRRFHFESDALEISRIIRMMRLIRINEYKVIFII